MLQTRRRPYTGSIRRSRARRRDDELQTYVSGSGYATFSALAPGSWAYSAAAESVYFNLDGYSNPGINSVFVTDANCTRVISVSNCNYMVVDGFTVRRSFSNEGIRVQGTQNGPYSNSVTVKNCHVGNNANSGITFRYTRNGVITGNISHHNFGDGILLANSDSAAVTWNESFMNDDPTNPRGGSAGIHIGDAKTHDSLVTNVVVDYNVVHDNEDSGIDLKGATRVVVRRNISYRNYDHGFDNNKVRQIRFINNIAQGNQHDGLSVEDTSKYVEAYNNIFMYNAVYGGNLGPLGTSPGPVREIFVGNNETQGFKSDHNVIYGRTPGTGFSSPNGSWDRHLTRFPSGNYDTFSAHQAGTSQDAHSYTEAAGFPDTAGVVVDFRIGSVTDSVVDRAKTDMTGWISPMWLATDPQGFVAYDTPRADVQVGGVSYSDIGAYEVDPAPGAPTVGVGMGRYDFVVGWEELGNDGDDNTATTHELYINGTGQGAVGASAPGTPICIHYESQPDCTPFEFKVKITDNNHTVWSNVLNTSTDCSGTQTFVCDGEGMMAEGGGGEESSTFGLEGADGLQSADYPLSVGVSGSNPARSLEGFVLGIPKAMSGSPHELSLFDVTGRRLMTVGSGTARSGRWIEPARAAGRDARNLAAGVYFLRLVVADKTLTRTVFLVP